MGRRDAAVAVAVALVAAFLSVASGVGAATARAEFGFSTLGSSFTSFEGEAAATLPAGSHPRSWTTTLFFNTVGPPGERQPDGALKNLEIDLPDGLVGSTASLPNCSRPDFQTDACPPTTRVGTADIAIGIVSAPLVTSLYLLDPLPGAGAQLGLHLEGTPIVLDLSIAPASPHNLIAAFGNASQADALLGLTLTLDGVVDGIPFLTLPRSCSSPLLVRFAATPWGMPQSPAFAEAAEPQALGDCASLSYAPELDVAPTTAVAGMPTGLDLDLEAPDPGIESAGGRASADTHSATLLLPPGMTLNPAVAGGLAACTPAELERGRPHFDPRTGCPEAARIGSASAETPLFDDPFTGELYVAEPDDPATAAPGAENPFDSLLALYLVLRSPQRGVLLSLPIRVEADPQTGRLSAELPDVPQLPLSRLSLHFNSGPRGPLAAPPQCGGHTIAYSLTPSSGAPALTGEDAFATSSGCDPSFQPEIVVGTLSRDAGSSAGFVAELANPGPGPNFKDLDLTLPPGLAADFTAVATCAEADVPAATCGAASRIGYARIAVGPGSEPLWVPAGRDPDSAVFLAGSYRGAPFSLLVRLPASAGPFDLGRVTLRAPLRIDPNTARVSVEFRDLPQVLDGIPLHYRTIRLVLDRPGFIRNPTSCAPLRTRLSATAANGATATAVSPFRADGCAALRFRPRLVIRLSGGLSRNGHPGLHLRLAARPGGAGVSAATVDLPAGALLETRHIRALCPRELAPSRCPASSRLGHARMRSPLLREPLRGPVFLRAPAGRYPELAADLRAGAIRVFLHGRTATAPGGRLRLRLGGLPDIPLSKVSVTLAGGRRGIVVNSFSLCKSPPRVAALLTGHNGRRSQLQPRVRLQGRC
jgi:hypothetical protein